MVVPRIVVVTRPTEIQALRETYGTLERARFELEARGRSIGDLLERDARLRAAVDAIWSSLPGAWRRVRLDRSDLSRFVFEPSDVIVPVGQDGLVANVAKYLDGQPVVGVNPDPSAYEGVLVTHAPPDVVAIARDVVRERVRIAERTMIAAAFDDGERLLALNEIFVGHRSHQSARYELEIAGVREHQSSSGVIVTSGTGATGWARSIDRERSERVALPRPADPLAAYFVREAFPGSGFAVAHTGGVLSSTERLVVRSEMNEGGVAFGDGIEDDHVAFDWGAIATVGVASERLRLVA